MLAACELNGAPQCKDGLENENIFYYVNDNELNKFVKLVSIEEVSSSEKGRVCLATFHTTEYAEKLINYTADNSITVLPELGITKREYSFYFDYRNFYNEKKGSYEFVYEGLDANTMKKFSKAMKSLEEFNPEIKE